MKSFFKKIKDGFKRTQEVVSDGIQAALQRSPKIDEDLYDEIEAILLRGDVGPATTDYLLTELRARVKRDKLEDSSELSDAMRAIMEDILTQGRAAGDPLSGPESPTSLNFLPDDHVIEVPATRVSAAHPGVPETLG